VFWLRTTCLCIVSRLSEERNFFLKDLRAQVGWLFLDSSRLSFETSVSADVATLRYVTEDQRSKHDIRTHLRGRLNHSEVCTTHKAVYKFYIHKVTVGSLTPATWWTHLVCCEGLRVFGRGHWKSWWGQAPSGCTQLGHENCRQRCATATRLVHSRRLRALQHPVQIGTPKIITFTTVLFFFVNPFGILIFFWRTGRYKSIHNLKIDTICMCDTPFDRSFFSAVNRYMTCNAIYWQKARIKSKTSVAQTDLQAAVYAKGFARKSYFAILVLCCASKGWQFPLLRCVHSNPYFCVRHYLLSAGCGVLGNTFWAEREDVTGL
jgi:hypothetical protein